MKKTYILDLTVNELLLKGDKLFKEINKADGNLDATITLNYTDSKGNKQCNSFNTYLVSATIISERIESATRVGLTLYRKD